MVRLCWGFWRQDICTYKVLGLHWFLYSSHSRDILVLTLLYARSCTSLRSFLHFFTHVLHFFTHVLHFFTLFLTLLYTRLTLLYTRLTLFSVTHTGSLFHWLGLHAVLTSLSSLSSAVSVTISLAPVGSYLPVNISVPLSRCLNHSLSLSLIVCLTRCLVTHTHSLTRCLVTHTHSLTRCLVHSLSRHSHAASLTHSLAVSFTLSL